jgi:hypothetical protein
MKRVTYYIAWPKQAPVKIARCEVNEGTDPNELLSYLQSLNKYPEGFCLYNEDESPAAGCNDPPSLMLMV